MIAKTRLSNSFLILLLSAPPLIGAERVQSFARTAVATNHAVVDPLRDKIFPIFYDGNGWNTNFLFTNLDNHNVEIQLEFWRNDGSTLPIPIDGIGTTTAVIATIPQGGTISLHTSDLANASRVAGYAYAFASNKDDLFSGYAVVRSIASNLPDIEFTVPISPLNESVFTLAFDNTNGYDTGVSLVNSSSNSAAVSFSAQDQNGNVIATDTIGIPPLGRVYFSTTNQYPQLGNVVGNILFTANGAQLVTGLGLRLGPNQSFTSVPVFSFTLAPGKGALR